MPGFRDNPVSHPNRNIPKHRWHNIVNATSNRQLIIHLGPSVISILMLVYYLLSGLQLKSNENESLIKLIKPNIWVSI